MAPSWTRVVVATALAAALAACGGGDGPVEPESLGSCAEVADAAVGVIQDSIDALDAAESGAEPDAEEIAVLEDLGNRLEDRARDLGCADDEMTALMIERADLLEADSVMGQAIIEGLRAGDGGFYQGG
jgi:hypothetical protein